MAVMILVMNLVGDGLEEVLDVRRVPAVRGAGPAGDRVMGVPVPPASPVRQPPLRPYTVSFVTVGPL